MRFRRAHRPKDSLAAGRVSPADHVDLRHVKHPGDLPFALINEFLDDLVTVTERDINEMILMLEKSWWSRRPAPFRWLRWNT